MVWRKIQGKDWSLVTKVGVLVAVASALPLVIQTAVALHSEERDAARDMELLLSARAEQVAHDFDGAHRGYISSASRLAQLRVTKDFCAGDRERQRDRLVSVLKTFPATDTDVTGASVLDRTGRIIASTNEPMVGVDLSFRQSVRNALAGATVVSNVFLSHPMVGSVPTVAYYIPVFDDAKNVLCVVAVFVNPDLLFRFLKGLNELAGPGSRAVIYDRYGVRIAHSMRAELLYHPAGAVEPKERDRMIAEQRFSADTAKLLADVRASPEHFARATAASLDRAMFASHDAVTGEPNYGVGVRMMTVPWTVFYLTPAKNLDVQKDLIRRSVATLGCVTVLLALFSAVIFARRLLQPVTSLLDATRQLASGDASARAAVFSDDEVGELTRSFNTMAAQIDAHEKALQEANDELEMRVRERTSLLNSVVRQRDELERSNRDLEAFSSTVSHDLRSPLFAIAGFSEALARKHGASLDPQALHYLERIRGSTSHMEELILAMLRLASVAKQPLQIERVPLEDLVRAACEELEATGASGQDLVRIGAMPVVECDRALMRQALHNLLSNACKFTSKVEKPKIEVGAIEKDSEWNLFVRDNGAGFNSEHAARLFQPFRRMHTTKEFPGLGIGLSIVQRIVERHGGRVWAESRPGEGACFWIALPKSRAA